MPQFLDLPRELRDMIYLAIITWQDPYPEPRAACTRLRPGDDGHDDIGCVYFSERVPSTCANVLTVNRQISHEMTQTIERARRKDMLSAKMDCIVNGDEWHWLNWRSLPFVRTTYTHVPIEKKVTPGWVPKVPVVGRLLAAPETPRVILTTSIEHLQIDVHSIHCQESQGDDHTTHRTGWAIFAALKKILETPSPSELNIATLILNVILPPPSPSPAPAQETRPPVNEYSRLLVQDLVNVWNALWANDERRAKAYRILLERIQRVRVCIDGVLVRERELRLELERGQRERRRIAMRVGW
jgi:hypothetical protein